MTLLTTSVTCARLECETCILCVILFRLLVVRLTLSRGQYLKLYRPQAEARVFLHVPNLSHTIVILILRRTSGTSEHGPTPGFKQTNTRQAHLKCLKWNTSIADEWLDSGFRPKNRSSVDGLPIFMGCALDLYQSVRGSI